MRGILCFMMLVALLAGCASRGPQACSPMPDGTARPVIVAMNRTGIGLDGDLLDWRGVPFVSVTPANGVRDRDTKPIESAKDLSFRFAVCHDEQALYIAAEVTDDAIVADNCEPGAISCPAWDDDAIEVFIDGNHSHVTNSREAKSGELAFGGEFALVANGAANSDYSGYPRTFGDVSTWQGASNWRADGRRIARYEMRISWGMMGLKSAPDRIGFSISAQDDDDGGRRDHALYFVGSERGPFVNEAWFADLIIER